MRPPRHVETELTHVPWEGEVKPVTVSLMLAQQLVSMSDVVGQWGKTGALSSRAAPTQLCSLFLTSAFLCTAFARTFLLIASHEWVRVIVCYGFAAILREISCFCQIVSMQGICVSGNQQVAFQILKGFGFKTVYFLDFNLITAYDHQCTFTYLLKLPQCPKDKWMSALQENILAIINLLPFTICSYFLTFTWITDTVQ